MQRDTHGISIVQQMPRALSRSSGGGPAVTVLTVTSDSLSGRTQLLFVPGIVWI